MAVSDKTSADGCRSCPQEYQVRRPTSPPLFFDAFEFNRESYIQDPPPEIGIGLTQDPVAEQRKRYASSVHITFFFFSDQI